MLGTEFCQMVSVIFSSDVLLANHFTQLARILGAKCEVKPLYTATPVAFCPLSDRRVWDPPQRSVALKRNLLMPPSMHALGQRLTFRMPGKGPKI